MADLAAQNRLNLSFHFFTSIFCLARTGKKEGNKFLPVNSNRFETGNTGKKEGNKFLSVNSSRFETGNTGKKGGSQILPVNLGKYHAKLSRNIPVKTANLKLYRYIRLYLI